jgi:sarcosine oxidase subunit delta
MLLIPCPYCGERAEIEFTYAGEAHRARPADTDSIGDDEWTAYLYMRRNYRGLLAERWRHSHGCGRFFNAIRDTVSDSIACSYEVGTQPPAARKRLIP